MAATFEVVNLGPIVPMTFGLEPIGRVAKMIENTNRPDVATTRSTQGRIEDNRQAIYVQMV